MTWVALPGEDVLPPGEHRDLVVELHRLYGAAGRPSLAVLSRTVRDHPSAPTTLSHDTVRVLLRGTSSVPKWCNVESLALALLSLSGGRLDADPEIARLHKLWLAAAGGGPVDPSGRDSSVESPSDDDLPDVPPAIQPAVTAVPWWRRWGRRRQVVLGALGGASAAGALLALALNGTSAPQASVTLQPRFDPGILQVPHCATFKGTGGIPPGDDLVIYDQVAEADGVPSAGAAYNFDGNAAATSDGRGWIAMHKSIGTGSGDVGEPAVILAVLMPHAAYGQLMAEAPAAGWAFAHLPPKSQVVDQISVVRNNVNTPCP
jgi:hypothetical protein